MKRVPSEPVKKYIEVERLQNLFMLLTNARWPKVTFDEDMNKMRAEAIKERDKHLKEAFSEVESMLKE